MRLADNNIYLHNEGYSTMCGHAIIAIATLAVEMKWVDVVEPETVLKIDASLISNPLLKYDMK